MTTGVKNCRRCGQPIPPGALDGNCPRCLALLAFSTTSGKERTALPYAGPDGLVGAKFFGDYQVLGELARGGMGIVYRARQVSLNRFVALKIAQLPDPGQLQRFRTETEAAARLDHRNIVPIYEVGEHQGQHFYSMKLIEGGTIADSPLLSGFSKEAKREHRSHELAVATCMAKVARAVHYAHQRGVLHRDLKPSNILLDAESEPMVSDFGLAKFADEDSSLTQSGSLLGTPAYMAPELASGQASSATTAADVYSLGAVLYHLLFQRPPFQADSIPALLRKIVEDEVTLPQSFPGNGRTQRIGREILTARIPSDLVTIALKCLEKNPSQRYASAEAVGSDLERWLRGEPICARPVQRLEQFWRWCRRKPALAGLGAIVVLLLGALVIGSVINSWRVNRAHEATELQRQNAVNANAHLEKANARLQSANAELGKANQAISDTVAILTMQRAESQFADGHAAMGLAYLAALVRDNPSNAPAAQRLLSALVSLPEGPSHQFVFPTIRSIDLRKRAEGLSFSPDGSKIMAVVSGREGTEGIARILDAASGISCAPDLVERSKINSARWSQDGQWVLTASEDGSARVWDAKTGTEGVTMHHPAAVQIASFSTDGRKAVTACSDGFARIWEARTGELLMSLQQQPGPVSTASFSPDGSRILTVCSRREKNLRKITCLWNAATGEQIGEPLGPEASVLAALFSPDGDFVLTVATDGARLWSTRDGTPRTEVMKHEAGLGFGAISPDGATIATASFDRTIRLWNAANGKPAVQSFRTFARPQSLAFTRDGAALVIGCMDGSVSIRDARTGEPVREMLHLFEAVAFLDTSPDGKKLATASANRVCIWDLRPRGTTGPEESQNLNHRGAVRDAAFSPHGTLVATASSDSTAALWELGRTPGARAVHHEGWVRSVEFSADGKKLLSISGNGKAIISDSKTGAAWPFQLPESNRVFQACFSPDGSLIAANDGTASLRIWNVETGIAVTPPLPHAATVLRMVFSPDGARIATAAAGEYVVRVWDIPNAKLALPLLRHKGMITCIVFSPDGSRLATSGEDGFLRLFDTSSGALIATPDHFAVTPGILAFSPDGCLLALLAGDAFLWDTKTWRPKEPLRQRDVLTSISFHPDGHIILTGAADGTARLWDAQTGQPLSDLLQHGNRINRVQFSPDRLHFLTASEGGSARVWNIPFASSVAPDWLPPLAEAIAGLHLNRQKTPAKMGWIERENAFEIVAQLPPTNQLITALQSLIARSR